MVAPVSSVVSPLLISTPISQSLKLQTTRKTQRLKNGMAANGFRIATLKRTLERTEIVSFSATPQRRPATALGMYRLSVP